MEDVLAPHRAPPGTLSALSAVVLTRRLSHLDSASYRTFSRLFSHFLHIHPSLHAAPAHPEVEPAAANPIGDPGEPPQGRSATPKDADFDRGKDVEEEGAVGNPIPHETLAPSGVQAAAANPIADQGVAPQGSPEREVAGVERVESVQEMVVAASTCGKTGAFVEEIRSGAGLVGEDEAFRSMKACLEREDEESVEVAVGNDNEQLLLDAMMTNFSGLIDDVSGGTMSVQSCGVSGGGLQNDGKAAEEVKELGGGIEEDRPVGNSDLGSADGGGFEEGEIEGDMQDLDADESGNSELEDEDAYDERLEEDFVSKGSGENESCDNDTQNRNLHSTPKTKGNSDLVLYKECNIKDDAQMSVARARTVSYDEAVDWNEAPLPDDETTKPGKKRKRHLTEERKAKKTKNKRVKRAQQRIAEGVKRLKLQPVIKPKVVQYCRFYLHGKCQQGNICKFSHDTTPLTKSKPCTHFARGSCLKGDDCPYNHELLKYPCHNFLENGMCVRGDKCKFSHVMPTAEGPSTPDAKKSDAPLVSEKANQREQTSSQKTSIVYNGEAVTSAPTKHYSILKNLANVSINAQKTSTPIPKGVQFLAFNKDRSYSSILHQDALSTEKHRYTNGGPHQNFGGPQAAEGKKIVKQNGQRSAPLLDEKSLSKEATLHPCSESKKTSLPTNSTAVPGSYPWMLFSDEFMPMRVRSFFRYSSPSFLIVTAYCNFCFWGETGSENISSIYSQGPQDSPGKSFTSLPRDNGSYRFAILVFDQHDSGHMYARIMGPSPVTSVSLVQCMI